MTKRAGSSLAGESTLGGPLGRGPAMQSAGPAGPLRGWGEGQSAEGGGARFEGTLEVVPNSPLVDPCPSRA